MSKHHLSIVLSVLICAFGALMTPLMALEESGEVEVTIKTASGTCQQVTVVYDTRNADEIDDTFMLKWTLLSDGVTEKTGSFETTRWSGVRTAVLSIGFTLSGDYEIDFEGNDDGAGDSQVFTATTCVPSAETTATNSNTPIEIPPCKLHDERLDETCGSAPIVTYSQHRDDGCYISIYSKYGRADKRIVLLLQGTPAEIAAAQAQGGNAIIDTAEVVNLGSVTLYWLPATGEFQINAGPNEEGKVYVLNFTDCPATNVYTTNSYQKTE